MSENVDRRQSYKNPLTPGTFTGAKLLFPPQSSHRPQKFRGRERSVSCQSQCSPPLCMIELARRNDVKSSGASQETVLKKKTSIYQHPTNNKMEVLKMVQSCHIWTTTLSTLAHYALGVTTWPENAPFLECDDEWLAPLTSTSSMSNCQRIHDHDMAQHGMSKGRLRLAAPLGKVFLEEF